MKTSRQSRWRPFSGLGLVAALGALFSGGLLATQGCGFGLYDDSSAPQVVSANDGVWDAGQWWPWACALPDGTLTNPAPQSAPLNYTATGTCGSGGAFALSVDGCEMFGNWDALGFSAVSTNIPSSIPKAGGWEVEADAGFDEDAGLSVWTCDATATDSSGDLTFTCTDGDAGCESTLKIASGS